MNKRGRNILVSWFKLFMAYEVARGHFNGHQFLSSGLCVNLFFIISGYFLAQSFSSHKYPTPEAYTINRIRKIYPEYLFSFILLFGLLCWIDYPFNIKEFGGKVIERLPEIFLVQNIGWYQGGINYPLWFLCVLIISSHILFALLNENKKITVNVICPLSVFCIGTYYLNMQDGNSWGTTAGGFLYVPFLRGICFISLGIVLYEIACLLMNAVDKFPRFTTQSVYRILLVCFWVIWVLLFIGARNTSIVYIPFAVLFLLSFRINNIKHFEYLTRWAERLSLSVFMNQAFVIYSLNELGRIPVLASISDNTAFFLIITTIVSVFSSWIVDNMQILLKYLIFKNKKQNTV